MKRDCTVYAAKGVNEMRGYRTADLRLCFRICEKQAFSYIYILYFLHVGEYIIQLKHVHTNIQQKKAKKNDKQTNYTIDIQNMVSGFK